ncbi:MAG: hypothetical protein EOM25_05590 [Deltaproteobacteria bacterium]|nr:hypothetical protein [Deltaproteobacteria bacterium]
MDANEKDRQTSGISDKLRVVGGELRWMVIKMAREAEIKRLKTRLDREFSSLGRTMAERCGPDAESLTVASDLRLLLKQVSFLKDEIAHLERELDKASAQRREVRNE